MPYMSTRVRKRLARSRRKRLHDDAKSQPPRKHRFFRFDASLQIIGAGPWHEEIARTTGLIPFRAHRQGESRSKYNDKLGFWPEDLWILRSPLPESEPLEVHLRWIWQAITPHHDYFAKLIARSQSANICLGCLSESIYPFFSVDAESLHILRQLDLGLSFNFTVT